MSALEPEDRIFDLGSRTNRYFEIGVHLLPDEHPAFVQQAFMRYANELDVHVDSELNFTAGNLWFVPVEGPHGAIRQLAKFTFGRVIRPMPRLRGIRPAHRSGGVTINCRLPLEQPLSSEPKVAILDGGLPGQHAIAPWLGVYRELDTAAQPDPHILEHGLAVSSAFLFGPIQPNGAAARPFAYVDHLRILDQETNADAPRELYRTLGLIEQVLLSRQYQFINLSLGPDLPIEDTDVHAWTSVIDDLLSDGDTLMTVAIGNNGQLDHASGHARVQVPSDCVNALAVGAADDMHPGWARAPYSAIGPGRIAPASSNPTSWHSAVTRTTISMCWPQDERPPSCPSSEPASPPLTCYAPPGYARHRGCRGNSAHRPRARSWP